MKHGEVQFSNFSLEFLSGLNPANYQEQNSWNNRLFLSSFYPVSLNIWSDRIHIVWNKSKFKDIRLKDIRIKKSEFGLKKLVLPYINNHVNQWAIIIGSKYHNKVSQSNVLWLTNKDFLLHKIYIFFCMSIIFSEFCYFYLKRI